jgi:hypothetical protein
MKEKVNVRNLREMLSTLADQSAILEQYEIKCLDPRKMYVYSERDGDALH